MAAEKLPDLVYDKLQIGEELGSYEYLLTQEMLDSFRASVEDQDAAFRPLPSNMTLPLWP